MSRTSVVVWGALARVRRWIMPACVVAMALSISPGCNSFQSVCSTEWMKAPWGEPEAQHQVSHVLTRWENNVRTTQNSQAGGQPLIGLAGRVYLMNEEISQNVTAQGDLLVQLYDMTFAGPNSPPNKLLEVRYDPISLKQLKRKDLIGEGYTLFLPWENYDPAVKKVQIQVSYQPRNGTPHFSDPTMVSLQTDQPPPFLSPQNVVPAAHFQQGQSGGYNANSVSQMRK